MSGHTPGPWFVEPVLGNKSFYVTASPEPYHPTICQTWAGPNGDHPEEANARLIAAAPELLEALRNLLANLSNPEGVNRETVVGEYRAARDAIAKATAEPTS